MFTFITNNRQLTSEIKKKTQGNILSEMFGIEQQVVKCHNGEWTSFSCSHILF